MELTREQERKIQLIYNLGADGIAITPNLVLEDTFRVILKKRNNRLAIKPFLEEFREDFFTLEDPLSKKNFDRIDYVREKNELKKPHSILSSLGQAFGLSFLLFGVFGSLVIITSMWGLGEISAWWFTLSGGLLLFYLAVMKFIKFPRKEYDDTKSAMFYISHIALINPDSTVFDITPTDMDKFNNFIFEQ